MLPREQAGNINGPSLIRTPDWLPGRLGTYYLYFAHHRGRSIRLAYADRLEGPWTVHAPGTMQIADAHDCRDHIASPDVHIDHERRCVVMYFHGIAARTGQQLSFAAVSPDGLAFTASGGPIGSFYLKVVPWRGGAVGMAKGGLMYLRPPGEERFVELPVPAFPMTGLMANGQGDVRHVALSIEGDELSIFFTRIGDAPERILMSPLDLSRPPAEWRAGVPIEILAPETAWEGADLPLTASRSGASKARENAVRDPAVFTERERTYLLYSVAGESGIAIAELERRA